MSQAELNGELFTLERFPPNAEEEALQAWEAADEYLLQQVNDVDGLTLIFNDGFGALACALAERNPVSINDSFISDARPARSSYAGNPHHRRGESP